MTEPEETALVEPDEAEEVKEHKRLPATTIYHIVRREGEDELSRGFKALWWSGIAAGISISFSVVVMGLLRAHLPDAEWRPVVEKLGYSTGFLLVLMARQQLFTENTITVVLPFMIRPRWHTFGRVMRLWGIVFAANMVGTAFFAANFSHQAFFSPEVGAAVVEISAHMMAIEPWEKLLRGIGAGWLIASLVWILPSAGAAGFWMILVVTYIIALADFTHVVAGATEAWVLVFRGDVGLIAMLRDFLLPTFTGNVIGGTAMFALIAYAQVREEIRAKA